MQGSRLISEYLTYLMWVVSCTPKIVLLGVGERRRKRGGNEVEERKEKQKSKKQKISR